MKHSSLKTVEQRLNISYHDTLLPETKRRRQVTGYSGAPRQGWGRCLSGGAPLLVGGADLSLRAIRRRVIWSLGPRCSWTARSQRFSKYGLPSAASVPPGNSVEMQILRPHGRTPESGTLGEEPIHLF